MEIGKVGVGALQELDLQIQYHPAKHNANADALLRFPLSVAVESSPQNVWQL